MFISQTMIWYLLCVGHTFAFVYSLQLLFRRLLFLGEERESWRMAQPDSNSWFLPLSPEDWLSCLSSYWAKMGTQSCRRRTPRCFSIWKSRLGEFGHIPMLGTFGDQYSYLSKQSAACFDERGFRSPFVERITLYDCIICFKVRIPENRRFTQQLASQWLRDLHSTWHLFRLTLCLHTCWQNTLCEPSKCCNPVLTSPKTPDKEGTKLEWPSQSTWPWDQCWE